MPSFLVPDDFRAFMRSVVTELDAEDDGRLVDAEDAFRDECGYGGRVDGAFRFHYLTPDGAQRWTLALGEDEVRAIADGLLIEVEAAYAEIARTHERQPTGAPLLIWGAYNDDALAARSLDDLALAFEALQRSAQGEPRVVRVWSPSDDQLIAVMWRDHAALYVIESIDGYATSAGDPRRAGAFEVLDHDGNPLVVPWSDCVPWPVASRALIRFAAHGDLGHEITTEGRIPSHLLMHGELDRQAVLAMRADPAREPARSSLPHLAGRPAVVPDASDATAPVERIPPDVAEHTAWGCRLVQLLFARGLLEPGDGAGLDEIGDRLSGLLQAHGDAAERSLETAEWLAHELGSIRGIRRLLATGGDLQLALRRSRLAE